MSVRVCTYDVRARMKLYMWMYVRDVRRDVHMCESVRIDVRASMFAGMYVWVCTSRCMFEYYVGMYVRVWTHGCTNVRVCLNGCMCNYVRRYVCASMYLGMYVRVCTYWCMREYVRMDLCASMYVCMYVRVCTYLPQFVPPDTANAKFFQMRTSWFFFCKKSHTIASDLMFIF
jgi:hypothetical protein